MKEHIKKTCTETRILELTTTDIIVLLELAGKLPGNMVDIKSSATVLVPGGGDWSNTNLSLDEVPLVVQVQYRSVQ